MPSIKFSADTALAYKLHQRSLREGRSISDTVKRIVEAELNLAPIPTPDAVEKHDNGQKVVVGAYLSGTLANAIEQLAAREGRSKSHVLRDLVRAELRRRGVLPPVPEKLNAGAQQ